jgi:hypothetical protein
MDKKELTYQISDNLQQNLLPQACNLHLFLFHQVVHTLQVMRFQLHAGIKIVGFIRLVQLKFSLNHLTNF